jgi:predicted transcriptional regulator
VSAAGKNIPVLVSPELVIEGVDAEPSANSIVCAPLVTTTVPLVVGNVSVVVPDTAGELIVTLPLVLPFKTKDAII